MKTLLSLVCGLLLCGNLAAKDAPKGDSKPPAAAEEKPEDSTAAVQGKPTVAPSSTAEKLKPPVCNGDQVTAAIRVVKLPRALASTLFDETTGPDSITEVKRESLKQLAEWEKLKKAATIFQSKITTMCGEESSCEAVREALYNVADENGKVDGSPTMRPIGIRFAALPTLSRDAQTIYFRLQFELTNMALREEKSSAGTSELPVNPSFSTTRIDTSLFMKNGATVLLSVVDDPENNGSQKDAESIELFLLTAAVNDKKP